jgi:hypothetical protein
MCPGQAMLVSLIAGAGLSRLTGWDWLLPAVMAGGTVFLIAGWHRFLNPARLLRRLCG